MNSAYVHGYQSTEALRLQDQADALQQLLHAGTHYPAGSRVLEAGCGVGAQTLALVERSPGAVITAIDISAASVQQARRRLDEAGITTVQCLQADILQPPFEPASFDHVFVCFVLEHLPHPLQALMALRRLLRPGGTLTVIEGDHGSTLFHPEGADARLAIECQVELQRRAGGNALVGRQLYPLLSAAGFDAVQAAPRMVYVDGSRPQLAEGFTLKTFTAMIEGVRGAAIDAGLASAERFDRGLQQLRRSAQPDGVFCYTFFKATAVHSAGQGPSASGSTGSANW